MIARRTLRVFWKRHPLAQTPLLREVMRQPDCKQIDLARVIGSRSRASELLGRKRGLTMEQAWKLHQAWHIPAEILLRPAAVK